MGAETGGLAGGRRPAPGRRGAAGLDLPLRRRGSAIYPCHPSRPTGPDRRRKGAYAFRQRMRAEVAAEGRPGGKSRPRPMVAAAPAQSAASAIRLRFIRELTWSSAALTTFSVSSGVKTWPAPGSTR